MESEPWGFEDWYSLILIVHLIALLLFAGIEQKYSGPKKAQFRESLFWFALAMLAFTGVGIVSSLVASVMLSFLDWAAAAGGLLFVFIMVFNGIQEEMKDETIKTQMEQIGNWLVGSFVILFVLIIISGVLSVFSRISNWFSSL